MTVRDLRLRACRRLETAGIDSPALDAAVLLAHVLGIERHRLALIPEQAVPPDALDLFDSLLQRRVDREPIAYLLKNREFYGRDFRVGPGVLVPRPDTETLVELALERLPNSGAGRTVLDAGTGSGCVAGTIKWERPQARVLASELSAAAVSLARINLEVPGVHLVRGDWLAWVAPASLDLLVSNPPYVDPATRPTLAPDLDYEPEAALFAAEAGLADLRRLILASREALRPRGWLLLEHGFDQGDATRTLAQEAGFTEITTAPDLAHRDRCLVGRWPG